MLFGAMDQVTTSWVLGNAAYRLATPPSPWPTSSSKESPAMGFETARLAREESYAIVTLNRPPRTPSASRSSTA